MATRMLELLSPNYTHDKPTSPCLADFVDVFEDMWKYYVLVPCEMLLRFPHGEVAAMMLLSPYFEAIWIPLSGEDSDRESKRFFVRGFCQVFQSESAGSTRLRKPYMNTCVADSLMKAHCAERCTTALTVLNLFT